MGRNRLFASSSPRMLRGALFLLLIASIPAARAAAHPAIGAARVGSGAARVASGAMRVEGVAARVPSVAAQVAAGPADENSPWSDLFNAPGMDGDVTAVLETAGGLIAAGAFLHIGRIRVNHMRAGTGAPGPRSTQAWVATSKLSPSVAAS